jgi:outer membrane protein OmpA-like peptidoglycan-associated protein
VKDFKEDQVELFTPKNLSGRSTRQMIVYYNILNILGDRLVKNLTTTIKLVGSSEKGPEDGRAMAESIQRYLVSIFGIDPSRIMIEGRDEPKIPSEQPGGTKELDLLREGDRRVSIESNSPDLLMEFLTGPGTPLKPVEIIAVQKAPLDSYVSFTVEGAKEAFSTWSLEIMDKTGKVLYFGPYVQESVSMPGKSVLGDLPEGDYKVTMIGLAKNGVTVKMDTTVNMVRWTPPITEEMTRFSIIYEFNESKAIAMYDKYLTDIVIPKIPEGGTVIIHGYTDIIGDEAYNQTLSLARANDVRTIIENGLLKAGRSDVEFKVYGFGEDQNLSPFENKFPEERCYNRSVIIDIIP